MILSPDAQGQIDGSVQKHILNYLPELPVDIVTVSWMPSFQFKEPQTKRWILFDFMEPHTANEEYNKFWSWVIHNPPILTFRRELDKNSVSPSVKPADWACYIDPPPVQTREEWAARPIEVLFFWGYSNASRPRLHGEIFSEGFAKKGIEVIDGWDKWHSSLEGKRVWMSVYAPWWQRKPMAEIVPIMQKSKITVSLPGNGFKTFRDTEVVGSLIAKQSGNIVYSFPWAETNSIQLTPNMEFYELEKSTQRSDLYELYVKCDANMRNYRSREYVDNYLVPAIRESL